MVLRRKRTWQSGLQEPEAVLVGHGDALLQRDSKP